MANLTNSAKLIEEMSKKANKTELPEVNNSTVNFTVNGNTGSQSMTTNQASNSTVNLTVTKATVGLGNVDNTSDANKPISTATQAALDLKANKSDISNVYKYKGSVASYSNLPSTGLTAGDVYNVEDTGMNYAWTGTAWDALGSSVDLSNYFNKTTDTTDNITQGNNKFVSTTEKNTWNGKQDALSTAQLNAANSGITSTKVNTYDGYATTINNKANTADVLTKTNTTAFTPTGDYQPATKKYVDDNAGTEYNAGEGISIGDVTINGRKGPSPDGFHVSSTTEWQGLKTIMDGLSLTTGDNWRINLHMPFAGSRDYEDASSSSQGSSGVYWSSSPFTNFGYAYCLRFNSSNVYADNRDLRADGLSVRCFKDSFEEPTSSWTVITGTLGSAGIFWNQTDGLISITDGTTGYTIMDKNLGATTVYNDGDTLTQANMGNMYQWGNNYGFPSTGTISNTSSTQVDASAYGPTNPYSSDTFITGSNNWSSVRNDDLWGDTTGTITQENAISNTGVLSVNGQTGDVTIPEPNVIAMTQTAYDALSSAEKSDGKLRIITDAPEIEIPVPDDTAFGSSWDGDTTHAPSKNAVYDAIGNIETLLAAL